MDLAADDRPETTEPIRTQHRDLAQCLTEWEATIRIAAHDLHESLAGIEMCAAMLAPHVNATQDPAAVLCLEGLQQQVQQQGELVNGLLELARVQRLQIQRQPLDLQVIVLDVVRAIEPLLAAAHCTVEIPHVLPTQACDPAVAQLFQQLITNAVKFNDRAEKRVVITSSAPGGAAVLAVQDNGIGIRPKHFETVFEPFRRLHPRARYGGGAGTGLTIARKIVDKHGGRIWIDSRLGEGTTVAFTLQSQAEIDTKESAYGRQSRAATTTGRPNPENLP